MLHKFLEPNVCCPLLVMVVLVLVNCEPQYTAVFASVCGGSH